jgi:hypothetical protein
MKAATTPISMKVRSIRWIVVEILLPPSPEPAGYGAYSLRSRGVLTCLTPNQISKQYGVAGE